jgi:hypothetical protein
MPDTIKITQEELQEFTDLKNEIQKNTFELGVLYLEKMELDILYKNMSEKEQQLRDNVSKFKQTESSLMDKMLKKYGEGSLNVREGVFIPN